MKALMFGWEFPPHILGGLGTASFGLSPRAAVPRGSIQVTIYPSCARYCAQSMPHEFLTCCEFGPLYWIINTG